MGRHPDRRGRAPIPIPEEMLGTLPPVKAPKGGNAKTLMMTEEEQHRLEEQAKKIQALVAGIGMHLGKPGSTGSDPFAAPYLPALRFEEALGDLKKLLLPAAPVPGVPVEANEEVAACLVGSGLVTRHLGPLLLSLRLPDYIPASIFILEILTVLTDSHPKWEFQEDHMHNCQLIKRMFGLVKLQERLLHLFIACITESKVSSSVKGDLIMKLFGLLRNVLAVPDPSEAYVTANGMAVGDFGRSEAVLRAMRESKLLEFLVVAAGSLGGREGRPFAGHAKDLADIFQLLLSPFDPAQVAQVYSAKASDALAMDEETINPIKRPIRHSNFAGSIVFKLSTGQDYVLRQGSQFTSGAVDLDAGKKGIRRYGGGGRGKKKIKYSYVEFGAERRVWPQSDLRNAFWLGSQLALTAFNPLMTLLLGTEGLDRHGNDDNYHWSMLRLAAWMLHFVRACQTASGIPVDAKPKIASVFALMDGDALLAYGRYLKRFHAENQDDLVYAIVALFRQIFRMIDYLNQGNADAVAQRAASDLQTALFYRMDLLDLFRLVFQALKAPSYSTLRLLVETTHVMLKLLDRYSSARPDRHFVGVAPKTRRKASKINPHSSDEEDSDHDDGPDEDALVEKRFEFKSFVAQFATEEIAGLYGSLLACAERNSVELNRYVAVMLYRLFQATTGSTGSSIFFRVAFLDPVHRFLLRAPPRVHRANGPLRHVCRMIAGAFFEALAAEPLLALEAFFPAHLIGSNRTPVFIPTQEAGGVASRASHVADQPNGIQAIVPESLTGDQRIRATVRKLVDAELVPHLHWLHALMLQALSHFRNSAQRSFPLVADTESQKRSLMMPLFASLLTMLKGSPPRLPERLHWTLQLDESGDGLGEFERLAWLLQRCITEALEEDEAKESSVRLFKPSSRAKVNVEKAKKKKAKYATIIEKDNLDDDEDDVNDDTAGEDYESGQDSANDEEQTGTDAEAASSSESARDNVSDDDSPGMSQVAAPAINKWRSKLTGDDDDKPKQQKNSKKPELPVAIVDMKMAPPAAKFSKWKEMMKTGMFTKNATNEDEQDEDGHEAGEVGGNAGAANTTSSKRRMIYSDDEDDE